MKGVTEGASIGFGGSSGGDGEEYIGGGEYGFAATAALPIKQQVRQVIIERTIDAPAKQAATIIGHLQVCHQPFFSPSSLDPEPLSPPGGFVELLPELGTVVVLLDDTVVVVTFPLEGVVVVTFEDTVVVTLDDKVVVVPLLETVVVVSFDEDVVVVSFPGTVVVFNGLVVVVVVVVVVVFGTHR